MTADRTSRLDEQFAALKTKAEQLAGAASDLEAQLEALLAPDADYDRLLRLLETATASTIAVRGAVEDTEKVARKLVVGASRAGAAEDRAGWRSAVTKASPFTAPTVRALGEANGIPPDPRYSRRSAANPDHAAPAPAAPEHARAPELPSAVLALSPPAAQRLARVAEERAEGGWAARVMAERPSANANWRPYLLVAAAVEQELLAESDLAG